jgi:hypothetical protein
MSESIHPPSFDFVGAVLDFIQTTLTPVKGIWPFISLCQISKTSLRLLLSIEQGPATISSS